MGRITQSRRVLVVGWGFLGAAVGEKLADDGLAVTGLTRSPVAHTWASRARGIRISIGDAGDPAVLDEALAGIDHVVCAAGGFLPPEAQESPYLDARGTLSPLLALLEALRNRPTIGLTYLSSGGTVYGNPVRPEVKETDPVAPISTYGVSRLASELYIQMYVRTYHLSAQILRCANVYGLGQPPERSQGAVAVFLHRVEAGLPIHIVGDGSAVRDYVHVGDVAHAVSQLVREGHDVGVVNVGSGRGNSVLELVERVSQVVGRPAVLQFVPGRDHDVKAIVLDITKLTTFIDYAPVALADGLRLTWASPAASSLAVAVPGLAPTGGEPSLEHEAAAS